MGAPLLAVLPEVGTLILLKLDIPRSSVSAVILVLHSSQRLLRRGDRLLNVIFRVRRP